MKRNLSIPQYRAIDLTFFLGILFISEALILTASRVWFPEQLYTVSAAASVVSIVMMRWGGYAGLHAFFAGALVCFFSGGRAEQYPVYCLGNLLALSLLLPLKLWGKERIGKDGFLSVAFGVLTQLFMQLGRCLVFTAMQAMRGLPVAEGFSLGKFFFTTDAVSCLFTGVVIWIARRLDGIFEDQMRYLVRIHTEQREEGIG